MKRNKFRNPAVMSGQCLNCEASESKNILIGVPPKVWMLKLLFFKVEIASAFIALYLFDAAAAAIALFVGAVVLLLDLLLEGESFNATYKDHLKNARVRSVGRIRNQLNLLAFQMNENDKAMHAHFWRSGDPNAYDKRFSYGQSG